MASAWKHQKFAREYFQHGSAVRALRACGSKASDSTIAQIANKFRNDPRTAAEIAKLQNIEEGKAVQTVEETKAEVRLTIDEALSIARSGVPIIGKNGEAVYDRTTGAVLRRADVGGMLKAAELKGKTVAMFTDRQQIAGEMEGKTDAELEVFFLSALLANPMLLERICSEEIIQRKVHEIERRAAPSGEGDEGDTAAEAESVSTSSQASGVSSSGLH